MKDSAQLAEQYSCKIALLRRIYVCIECFRRFQGALSIPARSLERLFDCRINVLTQSCRVAQRLPRFNVNKRQCRGMDLNGKGDSRLVIYSSYVPPSNTFLCI
jgi:hypothetical protein